ncbi:hypothetical protein RhiLY_08568 [Ceratobasidium sp. AG-Ba]|nr:hypothetical protein RhiLY_08568 [Ceratobasidium sp. AG-Ba]
MALQNSVIRDDGYLRGMCKGAEVLMFGEGGYDTFLREMGLAFVIGEGVALGGGMEVDLALISEEGEALEGGTLHELELALASAKDATPESSSIDISSAFADGVSARKKGKLNAEVSPTKSVGSSKKRKISKKSQGLILATRGSDSSPKRPAAMTPSGARTVDWNHWNRRVTAKYRWKHMTQSEENNSGSSSPGAQPTTPLLQAQGADLQGKTV